METAASYLGSSAALLGNTTLLFWVKSRGNFYSFFFFFSFLFYFPSVATKEATAQPETAALRIDEMQT